MKNRVIGDVNKKFKIKFNHEEDTYLIIYKNKDAARESADYCMGGDLRDIAQLLYSIFLDGNSKDRLLGNLVLTQCVDTLTKQRKELQEKHELQVYNDTHNTAITGKVNNLPPDSKIKRTWSFNKKGTSD